MVYFPFCFPCCFILNTGHPVLCVSSFSTLILLLPFLMIIFGVDYIFLLFSCDTWRPKKYSAHLISPLSCWKVIRSGTNSFLSSSSTSGDWPTFFVGRLNGTNTRSRKGRIVCSIVPLWRFLLHFLPFFSNFNPRLEDVCVIRSKHSGWICWICCLIEGM